jgi:hypothetical protein
LPVANGGTGQTSYTDGQLLIGNSTGNTLTKATLTAGTNVTITNAAGAITIAASGGGGSPGGSNTQLQYNNAGAFGGISGVTTDGTRITASTTIGVGGATPSTSGAGITFPATQSASSNANTLDDYEEGSWTMGVAFGGASVGVVIGVNQAIYRKIGSFVHVSGWILMANKGSSTGAMTITGLPFTASTLAGGFVPAFFNDFTGLNSITGGVFTGTTIALYQNPANGTATTAITDSNATNTSQIYFSMSYISA